ncbi:MAG TPA: sulfatase [Thermoanaerobaculia bacterium]|nr:sulfatase [Thermoanaerobaculia bacterium]
MTAIGCWSPEEPFEFEQAPIVLVDLSGLRADHLKGVAASNDPDRGLEALAGESVIFQWAFTPSPHAGPSRAALLSGRYPVALGLLAGGGELPAETTTLAERLAEHGYRTAAFVDADTGSGDPVAGLEQGFATWDAAREGLEDVIAGAIGWLREAGEAPFFLYLQASDLLPRAAELEAHGGQLSGELSGEPSGEPSGEGADDALGAASQEQVDGLRVVYEAKVREADERIGDLRRALDEQGLGERAIVVITSDRGIELAEHGPPLSSNVHATVARVPLALRLPGGGSSRVEPRITDLVDLAPTLLDLVGIEPDSDMQGESLVAILEQRGRPPYLAFTDSIEPDGGLAVAMAGYRLVVRRADDSAELYRLSEDPFELADVAAEEPEKVEVLRRRLEEWQRGVIARSGDGDGESADDEMLEQLRNLGYIQ